MNYLLNWFLVKFRHHRAIFRGKTFHCLAPRDGGVWIFFGTGISKQLLRADANILVLSIVASERAHDVYILVRNLKTGNMEVLLTKAPYDFEKISTISLSPDAAKQSTGKLVSTGEEVIVFAPLIVPQRVDVPSRKAGRVAH